MQPYTGDVWPLREELVGDSKIGEPIDMQAMRARVEELMHEITAEELEASQQSELVRVAEPAARRLMLGNREQRRRRKRRKRR